MTDDIIQEEEIPYERIDYDELEEAEELLEQEGIILEED